MNIVISDRNLERIDSAIKQAEGRAKERTIISHDLLFSISTIEEKLDIPKTAMFGITVDIDIHAQNFPRAYKHTPQSTHAVIEKTRSGWNLIHVYRGRTRALNHTYSVELTDEAREAIILNHEIF